MITVINVPNYIRGPIILVAYLINTDEIILNNNWEVSKKIIYKIISLFIC